MCEDELLHNLLARVNDLEERVAALESEKSALEADLAKTAGTNRPGK